MTTDADVRAMSTRQLRAFLVSSFSSSPEVLKEVAKVFGAAELRELRSIMFPTPCPTLPQTEKLLSTIAATSNQRWLAKLRAQAVDWNIDARGPEGDPAAYDRSLEIQRAAERRIAELRPPSPPARCPDPPRSQSARPEPAPVADNVVPIREF